MPTPQEFQNQFYQAPQEVPGYVNPNIAKIPSQPIDVYAIFGTVKPNPIKAKPKNAYETLMSGGSNTLIPDVAPLQTNLATLEPLDDPAGLLHSQDGFGKYGYSTILNGGDNEDRYSSNFRRDNPTLFSRDGLPPIDVLKNIGYWGGGFIEKTLESAAVKTGQGFAGLYGLTVGNTIGAVTGTQTFGSFDDWLSKASDNVFSNVFESWNTNLAQRYHYFQEKNDRDRKGFINSLGDGDFWMNDLSDGLGFLVSAAFEVGLISKLGLGTKVATRLSPLAQGIEGEAAVAQGAAAQGAFSKALNKIGLSGSGYGQIKTAVDLSTQTLATTAIEAASEAKEVKEKVYNSFAGEINPETGYLYSEDEKNRLAGAAAGQVFRQNMAILIGPKFLETLVFHNLGKAAKGLLNKGKIIDEAEGGASSAIKSRLGNLSGGTSYDKLSTLKGVMKVGSAASIGFLSEGLFEENIQLAISRTAEQNFGGGDEYYRPNTDDENIDKYKSQDDIFAEVGRRYYGQTKNFLRGIFNKDFLDDELSKSIGLGGLFGVVGGGFSQAVSNRKQAKIDDYWHNRIQKQTSSLFETNNFFKTEIRDVVDPDDATKTKPQETIVLDPVTKEPVIDRDKLKAHINKMNNIQGLLDIITNTDDKSDKNNEAYQSKELNKLARNVLFTKLAMEYIRAGKKELLMQNISSISQFSDKDLQQLGYDAGNMTAEEKKQALTKMQNTVDRLSKSHEWIENNVLDNSSEPRENLGGLKYSKAQKQRREDNFKAKKEYLLKITTESALLDSYLDDIKAQDATLDTSNYSSSFLPSIIDKDGNLISNNKEDIINLVSRDYNARIPAISNQLEVLQKQFAFHYQNLDSYKRKSPKQQSFGAFSKTAEGRNLKAQQVMLQEAMERMENLQKELDELKGKRKDFLSNNDTFKLIEDPDGSSYIQPQGFRVGEDPTLAQLNADKLKRLNAIKMEEIGIQKQWINDEWKQVAALKEEKTNQERTESRLSRRMTGSLNAYNQFFEREVQSKNNALGNRKLKLVTKTHTVSTKEYKANEEALLKEIRIQGKVDTIIADVNGKKLLAQLDALIEKNLPSGEFEVELKKIIDTYNGQKIILSQNDKGLVDPQLNELQDELGFVEGIFEYQDEDDRFNDKYYDVNQNGDFIPKPEYSSIEGIAQASDEIRGKIDTIQKVKQYLDSVPTELPGDWNNQNAVKFRISEIFTTTADSIIDNYNQLTNNGQSEITGEGLSTRQDLDLIKSELDEVNQLKTIFEERNKTDLILLTDPFKGFIEAQNERIAQLEKIKTAVTERLSSRLRENQQFLTDTVNNLTEQLGVKLDGTITNQALHDLVPDEYMSKLKDALKNLKNLSEKEGITAEEKREVDSKYWSINGQVAGIQEILKSTKKDQVLSSIETQQKELLPKLENTKFMQSLKTASYYKDVINNINDSVLATLQDIFYGPLFTNIGQGSFDPDFVDDKPSSPIYKFREDFNLRKLARNIDADNTRTPENSRVSKEDLSEFVSIVQQIKQLEDLRNSIGSSLNMLNQVELEKEIVQSKIEGKDNKFSKLIVPSIQQLMFIRNIAQFMRRKTISDPSKIGFRNWVFLQAPGGAGKTQTLGTWFNSISGTTRDRVIATAFTEEAAKGIKKALLVGEDGPKDINETIDYLAQLIKEKNYDTDVLIIDEFPAIDVSTQKRLFDLVTEYTANKLKTTNTEFKVITLGDTNQLTFSQGGALYARSSISSNPNFFAKEKTGVNDNHISKMNIIPSLTVNFRSNLFPITSFVDQFKGSNVNNVNESFKVTSTDTALSTPDVKGVVNIGKADFQKKLIEYLKVNANSIRTRALIVNESKIPEYEALLKANNITVIKDPNDEVSKGIYLTGVKNVQGFSFDEVFIDFENKDKTLFQNPVDPDYVYNKAMYVATSRAKSLIVTTNFPNIENVEDPSIANLESKALEELQTKDADFVIQRDLEIAGGKDILGEDYTRAVRQAAPVKAETKVESPLDDEIEGQEIKAQETAQQEIEEQKQPKDNVEDELSTELEEEEEGVSEDSSVEPTSGIEDQSEDSDSSQSAKKFIESIANKVKDKAIKAFSVVANNVIELIFPTGSTVKYKIGDNEFTAKKPENFENKPLSDGDVIKIVPFKKSQGNNSERKFGYAIVTPAVDSDNSEIPNSWRTVSILSDKEINNLKEKPETKAVYDNITENEKRELGFVSILYTDVAGANGFTTSNSKSLGDIMEGTVVHASPLKYFNKKDYTEFNKSAMEAMINSFIKSFYKNIISQDPGKESLIRQHYNNPANAQIIIPTTKDLKSGRLKKAPDFSLQPGRPYMMFTPYMDKSVPQYVPLSRKYLNTKEHNEELSPIRDFIKQAKVVKATFENKGITEKLGFSKSLSSLISKLAADYRKDSNPTNGKFIVNLNTKVEGKTISTPYTFSMIEAERISNLYDMSSIVSTNLIKTETPQEIENLSDRTVKNKEIKNKARTYTFEDGTSIYGNIINFNPNDNSYQVKEAGTGEISDVKTGPIYHSSKKLKGPAQEALDNIFNANGNIASKFISSRNDINFITASTNDKNTNYSFMSLLGSKTDVVAKNLDEEGNIKESFEDVIDILETLFNFGIKGELPGAIIQGIDVKFRVPVNLNKTNERGQLTHDYTYSSQNTSRINEIQNSRYFETNFESLSPTSVFIKFDETATTEEISEVGHFVQDNVQIEESPVFLQINWTKEELINLSLSELIATLTDKQKVMVEKVVKDDGFASFEDYADVMKSVHEEEQEIQKEYIVNCIL